MFHLKDTCPINAVYIQEVPINAIKFLRMLLFGETQWGKQKSNQIVGDQLSTAGNLLQLFFVPDLWIITDKP